MTSFTSKQLRATLILTSENTLFESGGNTLTLTGLRMSVVIQGAALNPARCDARIYGMLPKDMNALTVIFFKPPAITNNILRIEANDGGGWAQVFEGVIRDAQPDYRGQAFFGIQALITGFEQLAIVESVSYPGDTDVATIAATLAQTMGFKFEGNGVEQTLATPHFYGSAFDRLQQLAQAANLDFYIEAGVLAIVPANAARLNIPIVHLNQDSGLMGYPVLQPNGVGVDCVFDPAIRVGGRVQIDGSEIPNANGVWQPYQIIHALESLKPNGTWYSHLDCNAPGML